VSPPKSTLGKAATEVILCAVKPLMNQGSQCLRHCKIVYLSAMVAVQTCRYTKVLIHRIPDARNYCVPHLVWDQLVWFVRRQGNEARATGQKMPP
jgi:hypothetical protein